MTKTDTAPPGAEVEESQSELLFQALERFIDNMETSNRTLEWIEEQAREGAQVVREIASTVNRECYVQLSERLAKDVELEIGDFLVVRTGAFNSIACVTQVHACGTIRARHRSGTWSIEPQS